MDNVRPFNIVVQTFQGLETTLQAELKTMGIAESKIGPRVVSFDGLLKDVYAVNLRSRTALRVLIPISVFGVKEEQAFYDHLHNIQWDRIFSLENTFKIEVSTYASALDHSLFIAQKAKDAVVDFFQNKTGERPTVELRTPDFRIHIRISHDECTVSLDTSGEPLYKRGYRKVGGPAPANEILAAGLILLSGWDKKTPLVDPMCGSGTFLIEAALIAKNMPPSYLRKDFGFMKWKTFLAFDKFLFEKIKDESYQSKQHRLNVEITGSDIAPESLRAARENIKTAMLSHEIKLSLLPFDQVIPPAGKPFIITNPPYGERIKVETEGIVEIESDVSKIDSELQLPGFNGPSKDHQAVFDLYANFGFYLRKKWKGCAIWILTSNFEALRHLGLTWSKKYKVFNGPLECGFCKFDVFEEAPKAKRKLSDS